MFTGVYRELDLPVTEDQLNRWLNGEKIQVAMPHLTPDQREYIMTGVTAEEWNNVFGKKEEQ